MTTTLHPCPHCEHAYRTDHDLADHIRAEHTRQENGHPIANGLMSLGCLVILLPILAAILVAVFVVLLG